MLRRGSKYNSCVSELEQQFSVRLAKQADIPVLRALIDVSVRVLQREDYSAEQLEAALGTVYGVDTQLIADGTYYVVETIETNGQRIIVACGGWSKRKTLYGSDQGPGRDSELLEPSRDAAKIRAFFVHPDWVRRGLATLLLKTCEDAAAGHGFRQLEMGATLTGVPMYAARGYRKEEVIEAALPNGMSLTVVRMSKKIPA